jgi:tetratricopeptide (TPR) repeat protein
MADDVQEIQEAVRLARKTTELDKDDALALSWAGMTLTHFNTDLDYGATLLERALALNPNLMQAWYGIGWPRVRGGEPETATNNKAFTRAMRLSPLEPFSFATQHGIALAHLVAGRYDEASLWAEKALRFCHYRPSILGVKAAANALAGRLEEARRAVTRLRELNPALGVFNLKVPLRRSEHFAKLADGLRKAGLPE